MHDVREPTLASMTDDWDRDEVLAHASSARAVTLTSSGVCRSWGTTSQVTSPLIEIAANARADNHSAGRNDIARPEPLAAHYKLTVERSSFRLFR
jgi:hypothetical protein